MQGRAGFYQATKGRLGRRRPQYPADRSREEHPEGAKRFKSHTEQRRRHQPQASHPNTYRRFTPLWSNLLPSKDNTI